MAGAGGFPSIQGMTPVSCQPVGQDPLMCLALHPDGLHGACGDCSGRTVHFRTADAKVVAVKEGMHNFGVTSLAFSPPPGFPGVAGASAHPVRLASSSGDKTVRLQYWAPPAHLLAAATAARATTTTHQPRRRGAGGGPIRWLLGTAWALVWYALLAALALGAWFCVCCHLHNVPLARGWDRLYAGVYEEGGAALRPYMEAAAPYVSAYVGQAQQVWDETVAPALAPAWAVARPHWERAVPVVEEGWGKVCVQVGRGLDKYWWPAWEEHWPVIRARVEGWVKDWSQGEL